MFLRDNWSTATFITNYLPIIAFPILYIAKRLWSHVRLVRPEDMDFKTGLEEVLAASYEERPPRSWIEKIWTIVVSRSLACLF